MIRLLSIDDHPAFQEGLAAILNTQEDMRLIAQVPTGQQGIAAYCEYLPDLTLMDVRLPDFSGIEALTKIRPPLVATQLALYLSEQPLSMRESEILKHVATGNSNKEIGKLLFISEQTVKAHLRHIMDKLGASDRAHSVAIAVRRGFLEL